MQDILNSKLCFTHTGIGLGLPMVSKVLILKEYFPENFNMAIGLGFAGGGVGMVILPPLIDLLINIYGMRGALLVFSALSFNICVAGIAMKPCVSSQIRTGYLYLPNFTQSRKILSKHAHNLLKTSDDETNGRPYECQKENSSCCCRTVWRVCGLSAVAKSPQYLLYLASFILIDTAMSGWALFLFFYTTDIGFKTHLASYLSTVAGIGTLIGRLACGILLGDNIISAKLCITILNLGGCVSLFCYPYITSYWVLVVLSLMTGVFTGANTPVSAILIRDLFLEEEEDFIYATGLQYMVRGVGLFCGGPMTGKSLLSKNK